MRVKSPRELKIIVGKSFIPQKNLTKLKVGKSYALKLVGKCFKGTSRTREVSDTHDVKITTFKRIHILGFF